MKKLLTAAVVLVMILSMIGRGPIGVQTFHAKTMDATEVIIPPTPR